MNTETRIWSAGRRARSRAVPALGAALLLAACTVFAPAARGDVVDEQLFKHSEKILKQLDKAGCKNVGVLKFKVQVGEAPESYFAGRLNTLMATRLENVMVLAV